MIEQIFSGIRHFESENSITLFHGSQNGIIGEIRHDYPGARHACDFGKGFYMGTAEIQAKTVVKKEGDPQLLTLDLDLSGLHIAELNNLAWAIFVAVNRKRIKDDNIIQFFRNQLNKCDIIIGPIADDKLYSSLQAFLTGSLSDTGLIKSISALNLGCQYVSKSSNADANIKILNVRSIDKNDNDFLVIEELRNKANDALDDIKNETFGQGKLCRKIMEEFKNDLFVHHNPALEQKNVKRFRLRCL